MIRTTFFSILLLLAAQSFAQPVQTIRGTVIDDASNAPVTFATVALLHTDLPFGAITDTSGNFVIRNVPVGRYDLRVTYVGYEPAILRELTVISGKEFSISSENKMTISGKSSLILELQK